MNALPAKARLYVEVTCLLGVLIVVCAALNPMLPAGARLWELALLAAVAVAAGGRKVHVFGVRKPDPAGSQLTLGFAVIFATLLRFGPAAGTGVALLSCAASCLFPRRQPSYQLAFNLALTAIGTWVTGVLFVLMNQGGLTLRPIGSLPAIALSSLVYFGINAAGVAAAVALATGARTAALWRESFLWTAPTYVAGATVTALTMVVAKGNVAAVLLFGTPVAYLIYQSYSSYVALTAEKQGRIDDLRAAQQRLAGLVDAAEARTRQQQALVQLGVSAMKETPLPTWLQQVAAGTAAALGAHHCGLLRMDFDERPDGTALLHAAHGLPDEVLERAALRLDPAALAASERVADAPIVLPHIASDDRLQIDEALVGPDVASGAIAAVRNGGNTRWGLLACFFAGERVLSPDDLDFLAAVATIVGLNVTRARHEEQAEAHSAEIDSLNERLQRAMAETHHRVKNNLQIVSALIDIQVTSGEENISVQELQRLAYHVRALAGLHDLLTGEAKAGGDVEHVSTQAALEKLVPLVQSAVGDRRLMWNVEDTQIPVRHATALAVLVHELASNAAKHGGTTVGVTLRVEGHELALEVSDDGPGFPAGFDPAARANTGLELVERISRWDLQGRTAYANRPEGGARVTVTFPLREESPPRAVVRSSQDHAVSEG